MGGVGVKEGVRLGARAKVRVRVGVVIRQL